MQSHKKCIAVIACALLCCVLLPLTAFAHPGRTDSQGGHHDYQKGSYHYHHGYPAHDHPGGVCPYETDVQAVEGDNDDPEVPVYDNKENNHVYEDDRNAVTSEVISEYQVDSSKNEIGPLEIVLLVAWWGPILVIPIILLFSLFREKVNNSKGGSKYKTLSEKHHELLIDIWINALFGYFFLLYKVAR